MGKLTKNEINDYKINNIIRLAIYSAFMLSGLIFYVKEYLKIDAIINYVGVIFIITGVLFVWMNSKEKKLNLSNLDVIFGVLAALCGLCIIINPGNIDNSLTFYYGLFLMICGLQKLIVAIKLKKVKSEAFVLTLITALFIIGLGVLMITNVFDNISLTRLCGIFFMFFGLIEFANTVLINSQEKEIIKKN